MNNILEYQKSFLHQQVLCSFYMTVPRNANPKTSFTFGHNITIVVKSSHKLTHCAAAAKSLGLLLDPRTTDSVVLDEGNLTVLSDLMASDAMRNYSTRKSTECLAMFRETAMTASHDRVGYQYVLGYQTMQFCIRNPMNQFSRFNDDAMQSYCIRKLMLGN
jgi:hypothetical protein